MNGELSHLSFFLLTMMYDKVYQSLFNSQCNTVYTLTAGTFITQARHAVVT